MIPSMQEGVVDITSPDCTGDQGAALKKNNLCDSEITAESGGSVSEDEVGGWFGAIGSDFRNIASCFKDNIPPVIGGVADLVHQTALSVAAEIAQLERDSELGAGRWRSEYSNSILDNKREYLALPWEVPQDDDQGGPLLFTVNDDLMANILDLSLHESTFRQPHFAPSSSGLEASGEKQNFELDERKVALIERLLDIDENLAAMHARLSGRSNIGETVFWRNYFHHCEQAQKEYFGRTRESQILDLGGATPCDGTRAKPELLCQVKNDRKASRLAARIDENLLDDSSLIPASTTDDSSYVDVVPSAPNSMNTFMTTHSLEDMVLIDRDEHQGR